MTQTNDLDPILNGAAVARLDDRAFLRITGPDATRWLNGMVTNSIQALQPGEGCYNFLLNAQGRIQGDCTIYREYREPESGDPRFLLETDATQMLAIEQLLDKFIIMDDVELSKTLELRGNLVSSETLQGIVVIGEKTREMFGKVMGEIAYEFLMVDGLESGTYAWGTHDDRLMMASPNTTNQFEVWAKSPDVAGLQVEFEKQGAVLVSPETLEAFRIYEGRPKFGVDIRDKDLPQETNQPHALHFNKGCYLGQEIVERIRSRGQVHRLLTRFTLEGDFPAELPAALESNSKPAGEITSAAKIGDTIYALGYARREFLETRAPLSYPGGTATPRLASK